MSCGGRRSAAPVLAACGVEACAWAAPADGRIVWLGFACHGSAMAHRYQLYMDDLPIWGMVGEISNEKDAEAEGEVARP